jgi:septal ring factor EnvC (AmiA/AmiB activator)
MRIAHPYTFLLALCTAVPALGQNGVLVAGSPDTSSVSVPTGAAAATATPSTTTAPEASGPTDLTGFRDSIAQKKKALSVQVKSEENIVKKNGQIIEDAKKIAAANKKLEQERKQLEAQNAELDRQRKQMQAEEQALGIGTPAAK